MENIEKIKSTVKRLDEDINKFSDIDVLKEVRGLEKLCVNELQSLQVLVCKAGFDLKKVVDQTRKRIIYGEPTISKKETVAKKKK